MHQCMMLMMMSMHHLPRYLATIYHLITPTVPVLRHSYSTTKMAEETKKRTNLVETNEAAAAPTAKKSRRHQQHQDADDAVLPNAVQCTTVPPDTRLNIEALKNNVILSQILTEILANDGESKEKKEHLSALHLCFE